MKVYIGADHRGFKLKARLMAYLEELGCQVEDVGTFQPEDCDYPQYSFKVATSVAQNEGTRGILVCMTGLGHSIAANRVPGARATLCYHKELALFARQHNNSNILVLGANYTSEEEIKDMIKIWLETDFEGGRHERRLTKVEELAKETCRELISEAIMKKLKQVDPEIYKAIEAELDRQRNNLEMIASENLVSEAVLEAQGSVMTNKYAEGYPDRRWYGGCEYVDVAEQLAIERAKKLFGAEHVNVQPHSGSQANNAVYNVAIKPGDTVLSLDLACGGHLTHGHKMNFSGKTYKIVHYGVHQETEMLDYDEIAALAKEHKPQLILAGASAYPRIIDFKKFREICDEVGAVLFVDMAHIAGLVAAGLHPSPVPHAEFVTSTTHKTLRGPRGGMILCRQEFGKKIDANVFPGIQGGPLMHVIAAKAVAFQEALEDGFKDYQKQILVNATVLSASMEKLGYRSVSAGTDNHLFMVDLRSKDITGKEASSVLDAVHITVNKNLIPFDPESPMVTSGIRVGTPALTTRGMKEREMKTVAALMDEAITHREDKAQLDKVKEKVLDLTKEFPLYPEL